MVVLLILLTTSWGCKDSRNDYITDSITVVSYGGGAYQESHRIAFCQPFSDITGISVSSIVWNADYGKLKAMVESGRVPWDVVEVTAAQFLRGKRDSLFAQLTIKPNPSNFLPNSVGEYGIANVYWGTVLAYDATLFKTNPPEDWADFWDIEKFPGDRALYDDPRAMLEFALLADGISKDKLYPLDIDRAFNKLNEIRPYIRVFWTDGTQPLQLLLTNAVALSPAWNGRIYASNQAEGKVGYTWNGAALELDYWVVPNQCKNIEVASRFINYASSPYAMAQQAELVGYGPVNKAALNFVSEKNRSKLPTYLANWDNSFVVNAEWWSENEETVRSRWLAWKNK